MRVTSKGHWLKLVLLSSTALLLQAPGARGQNGENASINDKVATEAAEFDASDSACEKAKREKAFHDTTDPRVDGEIAEVAKVLKGVKLVSVGVSPDPNVPADPYRNGVYRGPAPNAEGLQALHDKLKIKTIINLEYLVDEIVDVWDKHPLKIDKAQAIAEGLGMNYVAAHMPATFCEPSECLVEKLVNVMKNPANYPIYIHCLLGEDRTGFVVGLYRFYIEKDPGKAAYYEMCAHGYKAKTLPGFHCLFQRLSGMEEPHWCSYFRLCAHATACSKSEDAISHRFMRFGQIDAGVFKGGSPSHRADFDVLKANNVKTIISTRFLPWHVKKERKLAKKYGYDMIHIAVPADPLEPGKDKIFKVMDAIANPEYQPTYFHCSYGRDRTGLYVALYRMYFQGWTKERALEEWYHEGFPDLFFMKGLSHFFKDHTDPLPYWLRQPLLAKALGGKAGEACREYYKLDTGREVFCQSGKSRVAAATLIRANPDALRPLAGHGIAAPVKPEGANVCEQHGGVEETLNEKDSSNRLQICRFPDQSAIEESAFSAPSE